jgi:thiol-disulfide isomerase/thioredoxin
MKKLSILILSAFLVFSIGCQKDDDDDANAPFLAPTTSQNKVAVLEDFTGVRCGYCPAGHDIAANLASSNPDKFIVIAVHAGSYAAPASGWPNFTTEFGQALIDQSNVSGYPAGTMNRHQFSGGSYNVQNNGLAMGRSGWTAAANTMMAEVAPVNIGIKSTFDAGTRLLTVKVDLYYTSSETVPNNINVALLESGLFGKQSGGTPDPDNYEQKHVLRHFITGQWGDAVPSDKTSTGSKYTKTYTYTVPTDYNGATIPPGGGAVNIANCEVVVFVSRGKTEILNGAKVSAN